MEGKRNLELTDGHVALRKHRRGDIGGTHQRIGAGNDDDGVVGIGDGDEGGAGVGLGCLLHEAEVYSLCRQKCLQLIAERILAKAADQLGRRAEVCRDRLVRALATGKVKHRITSDGLADARVPFGRRHHIHVDASGDENAAHALFPKELVMPGLRTPA